jgi:hypothetical protein
VNRHCDLTASVSPFSGQDWGRLRLFVWSALLIETKKHRSVEICHLEWEGGSRGTFRMPPRPRGCDAEKPAGRFMIRNRIRVVKRHPEGDW